MVRNSPRDRPSSSSSSSSTDRITITTSLRPARDGRRSTRAPFGWPQVWVVEWADGRPGAGIRSHRRCRSKQSRPRRRPCSCRRPGPAWPRSRCRRSSPGPPRWP